MEIKIKSIHFDATDQLKAFIEKKVEKEVIMAMNPTVEGEATAMNKEASLSVTVPGSKLFVEKTCDTFEEAIDQCVDSMKVQLTKFKEKSREN